MKNSIFLIALAAILLTACSKEESVEQFEEQNIDSVYVLNQINENASWDSMLLDNPQNDANYAYEPYFTYRAHTRGLYTPSLTPSSRYAMTLQWTGTQSNHGSQGKAVFKQSTPNFKLHFIMKTVCISVKGREAVYGGTITKLLARSGNAPLIDVGWNFYFKVIDNGIGGLPGGIVPYDKISNMTIFASPMQPILCYGYSPSSYIWSSQGYSDVIEPGFVEVNRYETE